MISIIIANRRESENIWLFEIKKFWLSIKEIWLLPINNHWVINAPKGTNIDNWSNCALLLIFPPRKETIQEQINVINSKLLLISIIESGQLRLAIDTQARAVIVPIPWEITKAGGTIIDKGLVLDPKIVFIVWTINRSETINRICLEFIVGFSFLETSIKKKQLIKTSKKDAHQENITELFKNGTRKRGGVQDKKRFLKKGYMIKKYLCPSSNIKD